MLFLRQEVKAKVAKYYRFLDILFSLVLIFRNPTKMHLYDYRCLCEIVKTSLPFFGIFNFKSLTRETCFRYHMHWKKDEETYILKNIFNLEKKN